jgi:hypothetical protein
MRLSFSLALVSLFAIQALALMFERVPQNLGLLRETPLLNPAASLSPLSLCVIGGVLFLLFFTRLRRDPSPLAAGSFLNGVGHGGLQVVAIDWLVPYFPNPVSACVIGFAGMAVIGSWRAIRRPNEDDSMALIAYFISVIASIAFGYFVLSHFGDLNLSWSGVLIGGVFLASLPAYFSARACATQIALIQPGGGRAMWKVLSLNALGGICGAVAVAGVSAFIGVAYATVLVAAIYLLAAWLFTQGREPFAGIMVPSA